MTDEPSIRSVEGQRIVREATALARYVDDCHAEIEHLRTVAFQAADLLAAWRTEGALHHTIDRPVQGLIQSLRGAR